MKGRRTLRGALIALAAGALLGAALLTALAHARTESSSGPVFPTGRLLYGLHQHPSLWLYRAVRVRGMVGSVCPAGKQGVLRDTGCPSPPNGVPRYWLAGTVRRAERYDPRHALPLILVPPPHAGGLDAVLQVLGLQNRPAAPPRLRRAHMGVYTVTLRIATPCPIARGPASCVVGAISTR